MAWQRKISRRKKTTLTVVGVSGVGALIAWMFWADLKKVFIRSQVGVTGKGIKPQTLWAKGAVKAFESPTLIAQRNAEWIQQMRNDGYTEAEIQSALTNS